MLSARVHVAEHASELPRKGGDALTRPSDVFLTSRWLDVVESTAGVPMKYLWTERDGARVAGLATAFASASVPRQTRCRIAQQRGSEAATRPRSPGPLPRDATCALMPSLVAGGRHLGNARVLHADQATMEDLAALVTARRIHWRGPPVPPASRSCIWTSRTAIWPNCWRHADI